MDYTSDYQSDEELSINSNKKVNKKSNLLENNQQHELGLFSEDELHDKSVSTLNMVDKYNKAIPLGNIKATTYKY